MWIQPDSSPFLHEFSILLQVKPVFSLILAYDEMLCLYSAW
jgi:hypothetical protein